MSGGQSYVIRPAASDDVAAATALVRRSIAELCQADHHNIPPIVEGMLINKTQDNMQAWVETPGSYVLVAEAGPILAGVGGLTGEDRLHRRAEAHGIDVLAPQQRAEDLRPLRAHGAPPGRVVASAGASRDVPVTAASLMASAAAPRVAPIDVERQSSFWAARRRRRIGS